MEYFDLYTADGHQLNKVALRGDKLQAGEFFLVVHVWIERSDGLFLIQQRAKKNDPIPFQWAITTGLPNQGEAPLEAAVRETYEELGVVLDKEKLEKRARIVSNHNQYNTITHVYHTKLDVDLSTCILAEDEVKAVQYASLDTIVKMASAGEFWDYRKLLDDEDYFNYVKDDLE